MLAAQAWRTQPGPALPMTWESVSGTANHRIANERQSMTSGLLPVTAYILMSLVVDKFGLFGMETHGLSAGRMVGGALMVAGVALISYF